MEFSTFCYISLLKISTGPLLATAALLDAAALRLGYGFSWINSAVASVYANAFSLVAGFLLYSLFTTSLCTSLLGLLENRAEGGLAWQISLIFTLGLFVAMVIFVATVDTVLELGIITLVQRVPVTFRSTSMYLMANILGFSLIAATMLDHGELAPTLIPHKEIEQLQKYYSYEIMFLHNTYGALQPVFIFKDQYASEYSKWQVRRASLANAATRYRFVGLSVHTENKYPVLELEKPFPGSA